tara:strand:- start:737 stop:1057 length:321 start_codon:yes stop_codon:yes gene_type:complete
MKTKDKVKLYLDKYSELKDDDNKLFSTIWINELKTMGYDAHKMSGYEVLKMLSVNRLTSAPSIKRARAKIQEEEPKYRGQKYHKRKGKLQDEWREDLGYPTKMNRL